MGGQKKPHAARTQPYGRRQAGCACMLEMSVRAVHAQKSRVEKAIYLRSAAASHISIIPQTVPNKTTNGKSCLRFHTSVHITDNAALE